MMRKAYRICFVSPWGYAPLARDRRVHFVGGAEVQQAFLAPELARRGHEVSMVTMDFGQAQQMQADGVTIYKTHAPAAGIPGFRFFHPRLTSLWAAMKLADADIYYQRGGGAMTGFVAAFARRHGRKFIFASACDLDFEPALTLLPYARDRAICRYGLRRADAVVVQTDRQGVLCQESLGRGGVRAPSCFRLHGAPARPHGPILWVGTVKDIKRPQLLLDVAERLPNRRFVMIGGNGYGDRAYFDAMRERARALGNVEFVGHVPYADIEPRFDGGSLLLNTSAFEGFPNTFLQAWSRGMPTVSFFDPQMRHEGAAVAGVANDVDDMVERIETLLSSSSAWQAQGRIVRSYFERHHSVEAAVSVYESVIASMFALTSVDRQLA